MERMICLSLKVKDVMTHNVAFVSPTTPVIEAARLMQKHNVGIIPVCDNNGLVGVVTDRDIVVRNVAHGTDFQDTNVKDIMTSKVYTVTPETDVESVYQTMAKQQIRRVPVTSGNQLVGIVALGDIATNQQYDTEAAEALSEISKPSRPQNF